jgi:predicted kinase
MENSQLISDVELLAESLKSLPEPVARPTLVVVSGLPGTGKSHFCAQLAERADFAILESDALRKELFPKPAYSLQESARLFRAIHHLLERLLRQGIPAILDATTLLESHREQTYGIAERTGARLILVEVEAPPELVYSRLGERESLRKDGRAGKSDADWGVYLRMKPTIEKIRRRHYSVDTSRDVTPVIDQIVSQMTR